MANKGNDWNSFMQSQGMQLALNGLCTVLCAYYALDAVLEMTSPERSATLIATIGATPYYLLTAVRGIVCLWVAVVFGRMVVRTLRDRDNDHR